MATGSADITIYYSINGESHSVGFSFDAQGSVSEADLDDIAKAAAAKFDEKFTVTSVQRSVSSNSWDTDWSWT